MADVRVGEVSDPSIVGRVFLLDIDDQHSVLCAQRDHLAGQEQFRWRRRHSRTVEEDRGVFVIALAVPLILTLGGGRWCEPYIIRPMPILHPAGRAVHPSNPLVVAAVLNRRPGAGSGEQLVDFKLSQSSVGEARGPELTGITWMRGRPAGQNLPSRRRTYVRHGVLLAEARDVGGNADVDDRVRQPSHACRQGTDR